MNSSEKTDYVAVPLAKIFPDEPLCADVYLKIGDKFVKFKEKGDCVPVEKYNHFISKHVNSVYVEINQLQDFMNWLKGLKEAVINEVLAEVGEENRPVVEKCHELKERIFETFADEDLDSENVLMLKNTAANIIEEFSKNKIAATVLAKLSTQNNTIAEHSVNVANMAVFLAMALGHGHQYVLENVYMGALFHDYAKSKIPEKLLENPKEIGYSQAIQDHPMKGRDMMARIKDIDEPVLTIIAQHHEQYNGKGYPKGLAGDKIYNLAQIVSIANIIDNILIDNKSKKEKYKLVLKAIEYDRGKNFNPLQKERVCEALTYAFKDKLDL